jgi:hypothetical protein
LAALRHLMCIVARSTDSREERVVVVSWSRIALAMPADAGRDED